MIRSPFERPPSPESNSGPPRGLNGSTVPRVTVSKEVADYWSVDSVPQLLTKLKLPKYIDLFDEEEIDLPTLLTLDDADLVEIGVKTFGARKRICMAIMEIRRLRLSDGTFLSSVLELEKTPAAAAAAPEPLKSALSTFAKQERLHKPRQSPPGTPPRGGAIGQLHKALGT
mmetsp:Transcript_16942/g.49935  ORF Transcript_16942/g.49935 Transcript_16942/m.49935 type:complete len:171 (-) Transcript_16942:283-795(-)